MIHDLVASDEQALTADHKALWERYRVPISRVGGSTREFYELARAGAFILLYDAVEELYGVARRDGIEDGSYWDRTELGHALVLLDAKAKGITA